MLKKIQVVVQPCNTLAYNESDSKKKNHTALSVTQVSRTHLPLKNQDGVQKWTSGSTSSNTDLNGNQNRQCSNLGTSGTTLTRIEPKMKGKKTKIKQRPRQN